MYKSDTYKNIEKMIEKINVYRSDFTSNRSPTFEKYTWRKACYK